MMSGALMKLTIIPFRTLGFTQEPIPAGPPIIAQFNPETFSISTEFDYAEEETSGSAGSEGKFEKVKPRTFSFDLLYDGTGASSIKLEVLPILKLFELTTGFLSELHRPSFFMVSWGTMLIRCVLKKYTINYKLFSSVGLPKRAVISTEWQEVRSEGEIQLLLNLMSPDVTHHHVVDNSEHLPLICYRNYEDSKFYYEVARKNDLNNLREINAGDTIKLFPIK